MGKFVATLKKKGPGGIPVGVWAGIVAVVLYLGYRYYKNKSGGTTSTMDTTGATPGVADGAITDSGGGSGSAPTPVDNPGSPLPNSGELDVPTAQQTGALAKALAKLLKNQEKSSHDKRQGTHHTKHKRIHQRKHRHRQHPPKEHKRPHSHEKRHVTKNMKHHHHRKHKHHQHENPPPNSGGTPPPKKPPYEKVHPPGPIAQPTEGRVGPKAPPKKPMMNSRAV